MATPHAIVPVPLAGLATRGITLLLLAAVPAWAENEVLARYVGNWDIHATTLQPQRSSMTYQEEYRWTLDGHYIEGRTSRKPDGSYDIVFGTYEEKADGYPFWIFSSAGSYTYVPPGKWNARKSEMTWESPQEWDVIYSSRCHFPSDTRRDCHMLIKDWRGKVILELEWRALRRED